MTYYGDLHLKVGSLEDVTIGEVILALETFICGTALELASKAA